VPDQHNRATGVVRPLPTDLGTGPFDHATVGAIPTALARPVIRPVIEATFGPITGATFGPEFGPVVRPVFGPVDTGRGSIVAPRTLSRRGGGHTG
jgi:hypothetical protein